MLDGLFRPRSIAVIGASNNPFSIGHIVIRNLAEHGFKGPIFPINPKERSIATYKCFKSVADVPDEIDLVNISVAAKLMPQVIEECGKKGVKFAIVHSAGFKEVGEEGIKREREMVELAHKYGMRIYGPNSQGVQNSDPEISAYANFTFVPMKPGNISIIAQGGGMGELLKLHLHNVGLGHRLYCSYGNEADLTMPEILEYYGKDDGTAVIMMQIESFKDPAAFLRAAGGITPRKPILAIKAGRTREGSVAVSSHTGTLVDQAAMATAMFKKAGVVEFHDSDEMVKAAIALSCQPVPKGKRIGIITNTGGPGIQVVDESVDQGLVLAKWSDEGRKRLRESLYAEASVGNPVDVVATAGADHFFAAVDTLLKEDGVDMVMVFFVTAPFVDLDAIARRIKEATVGATKPVVVVVETSEKYARIIKALRETGVPVYEFPEDGARALAAMTKYGEYRGRKADEAPPELPSVNREAAETIVARHRGKNQYISQPDAFALLSAYGVGVPQWTLPAGLAELESAAKKVGFPCVLKADSPEIVHKSDEGGVALGIADLPSLRDAYRAMADRFHGRVDARFILQEQKPAGLEVIIGATAAPGLGSLVMFGLGGIFVEVMKDVTFHVAPMSREQARQALGEIKARQVLQGLRGQKGANIEGLEDLLVRVSRLAADFPEIVEMDLNPVFAYPSPEAPVAVDVRVKIQ